MKNVVPWVILVALLLPESALSKDKTSHAFPMVGLLEDAAYVRVVFVKKGKSWEKVRLSGSTVTGLPSVNNWHVCYQGREIGRIVTGNKIASTDLWQINRIPVDPKTPAPVVGEKTEEFSGWLLQKRYRPLVVVNGPRCKDPRQLSPRDLDDPESEETSRVFIDRGDYDGDRRSETVVMVQSYNYDGYEIRNDRGKSLKEFGWSYH